ncbi:MAG: hypothetical protein GX752_08755 [Clostridium sp.]|nr:hypothetical protein [Clostridium sp.]
MNLYKKWNDMVVEYVKTKGEKAFWDEYSSIEEKLYSDVLKDKLSGKEEFSIIIQDKSEKLKVREEFIMGFLDGINDSLEKPLDLEKIKKDDIIKLNINFEKLYYNMVDAKAEYLYNLKEWEDILDDEKRKELFKEGRESKTVVNENKVGRNDPCPCGSGKKYKKCHGKIN